MIEWMELQRLLGVSMIGVYGLSESSHSLVNESLAVLRHYCAEGFVELRKSDYIPDGPKQVSSVRYVLCCTQTVPPSIAV